VVWKATAWVPKPLVLEERSMPWPAVDVVKLLPEAPVEIAPTSLIVPVLAVALRLPPTWLVPKTSASEVMAALPPVPVFS